MKKVLFATTALVASAGFAAADVDLTGSAEMGIVGGDYYGETQFHHDIDVTFKLSGETDNGLTFGATIDLDEVDNSGAIDPLANETSNPSSVFLSGNFGTITMGDTDGAFDWALTEAILGGAIDDAHEHSGYSGNGGYDGHEDNQVARYDYSFGDFAFAVSIELDDFGSDDVIGVGGKYSADLGGATLAVGLGFQSHNGFDEDIFGVSFDVTTDAGFRAILNYSDGSGDYQHTGIALGYTMDALSVALNWGQFDGGSDGMSVSAVYDLGGGAKVQAAFADNDGSDSDKFSLGVAMSF